MNQFKTSKMNGNNQKYKGRYINRFMGMKAAPDMLCRGLFPNAKEITESFGAFEAIKHLPVDFKDDVAVVCVGDGHTPRTGAVCAFSTKWDCYSVDPLLRLKEWDIKRLTCKRFKIQDTFLEFDKPCIIMMVHAHVRVNETLPYIKAPIRHLITMECCVSLDHKDAVPDEDYKDDNIWSPMNRVRVWKNV